METHRIDKKMLLASCKKNDLYTTPSLNDRLYLHFQGIREIENLDEYENLKGATPAPSRFAPLFQTLSRRP